MAVTLSALFAGYMTAMETALSIDVILGYPDTGRTTPTLPLAAVTFSDDDYGRTALQQQNRRIGQSQPTGRSAKGNLYLYAASERALLGLVDTLYSAKGSVAAVVVDSINVTVSHGQTVRLAVDIDETQLRFGVVCEVLFNWNP